MVSEHFLKGFEKRAVAALLLKPILGVGKKIFGKGLWGAANATMTGMAAFDAAKMGARLPAGSGAATAANLGRRSVGITY